MQKQRLLGKRNNATPDSGVLPELRGDARQNAFRARPPPAPRPAAPAVGAHGGKELMAELGLELRTRRKSGQALDLEFTFRTES
ncbi:hypothetical protein EVAR_27002_1 [Eumeta japonica]|uniref:Uncharacterized protein n=1 Tax=Eumeta variegata TaxID=151549 RepID=A0A4C1Z7Q8_EUMVA|nr:hypothetical protein EVAR_27002_1 [Eumeta japonica]